MIFFPPLYDDELLYSGLARYHRQTGNFSTKRTLAELFGSTSICATTTFSSNLNNLWERLNKSIYYDPNALIAKYTLLPYYAPFLPTARFEELKRIMREDNGTNIYMKLGKVASAIKSPLYLRYCPKCLEDDKKRNGEAYWRRTHQIEGVQFCHIHCCLLIDSSIPLAGRKNKHAFYTVEHGITSLEYTRNECSENIEPLMFISKQSHYLLNNELLPIGLDQLYQFYKNELLKKGFVSALGEVRCAELRTEFIAHYGPPFLQSLNCYINPEDGHSWLHKLVRKPRVTCHPLRHILLLGFLGKEIAAIYENHISTSQPFGPGPWMCLNKAALHYKQQVISDCAITRCSDTGKPVGIFSCLCGFVYSRRGPDKLETDLCRIGRIKSFGQVWTEKLHELNQTNFSLRKKAEILGVDPNTVKRQIEVKRVFIQANTNDDTKNSYRLAWSNLLSTYYDKKIVDLRSKNQGVYKWLYRNDREWLMELNAIRRTKAVNNDSSVDWAKRDSELVVEVEKVASEIRNDTCGTIRITTNEIGRRLHKLSLISNKLCKLPQSQNCLNVLTESVEQFQIRRIKNTIQFLNGQIGPLQSWKVRRISGLKKEFAVKYDRLIEDEIRAVMEAK